MYITTTNTSEMQRENKQLLSGVVLSGIWPQWSKSKQMSIQFQEIIHLVHYWLLGVDCLETNPLGKLLPLPSSTLFWSYYPMGNSRFCWQMGQICSPRWPMKTSVVQRKRWLHTANLSKTHSVQGVKRDVALFSMFLFIASSLRGGTIW